MCKFFAIYTNNTRMSPLIWLVDYFLQWSFETKSASLFHIVWEALVNSSKHSSSKFLTAFTTIIYIFIRNNEHIFNCEYMHDSERNPISACFCILLHFVGFCTLFVFVVKNVIPWIEFLSNNFASEINKWTKTCKIKSY